MLETEMGHQTVIGNELNTMLITLEKAMVEFKKENELSYLGTVVTIDKESKYLVDSSSIRMLK